ncbi:uncharacterized protein LOC122959215 [Acropora millepora]|uniref:uncharacterized protein LOC122959215 n=1 Tax=Acropora millepora TaxID=45264 RepID=UPI001CF3EC84|nr:uncharacterized protein LOC122959215 [Acropora millepora]
MYLDFPTQLVIFLPHFFRCFFLDRPVQSHSSRNLTTNDPSWRAGGTTLQGHSFQYFEPTDDPITADPSKKVELVLRLVAREDEPDVNFSTDSCTPLSTLVPPPVPE